MKSLNIQETIISTNKINYIGNRITSSNKNRITNFNQWNNKYKTCIYFKKHILILSIKSLISINRITNFHQQNNFFMSIFSIKSLIFQNKTHLFTYLYQQTNFLYQQNRLILYLATLQKLKITIMLFRTSAPPPPSNPQHAR